MSKPAYGVEVGVPRAAEKGRFTGTPGGIGGEGRWMGTLQ